MKTNLSVIGVFLLATLISSCGSFGGDSNDGLKKALGNSHPIWGFGGEKIVEELGITIFEMKLHRSSSNENSPGAASIIDQSYLEIWYKLDGDDDVVFTSVNDEETNDAGEKIERTEEETAALHKDRRRYAKMGGFKVDKLGNLYKEGSQPGSVSYDEAYAGNLHKEGAYEYRVTPKDGLVTNRMPNYVAYSETTGDAGETITVRETIKAEDVPKSDWSNVYDYSFAATIIAGRTHYQSNTKGKVKAKLGCLLKTLDDTTTEAKTYKFGEVELGATLQDSKDKYDATSVDADETDTLGSDDKLWIQWSENYYISGLNISSGKLRLVRHRSAPFYQNRELPGVDDDVDDPKLSGMDALVRACNTAAEENGTFQLLSLGTAATPDLTIGTANAYCSTLDDADTDTLSTADTTYGACGFTVNGVVAGTFDGSEHTGPISSAGGTVMHHEMSAPTEVQL